MRVLKLSVRHKEFACFDKVTCKLNCGVLVTETSSLYPIYGDLIHVIYSRPRIFPSMICILLQNGYNDQPNSTRPFVVNVIKQKTYPFFMYP